MSALLEGKKLLIVNHVAAEVIPDGTWALVLKPEQRVAYVTDTIAELRVFRIINRWFSQCDDAFDLDALDDGELVITDSPSGVFLRQ